MNVHFSSKKQDWETPQWLFDELNEEFHFNFDVCANVDNTKCGVNRYEEGVEDGLKEDWEKCAEDVPKRINWMNPPYGREIGKWIKKASETKNATTVCLLPARTDTKWFHDYILGKSEVRFLKGRLKFGNSKNSAPFPSMIVIFN